MASKTNLFGFEQREPNSSVDATLIFEKINKELGELTGEDSIKKRFIRALTHTFALLLNTKVDSVDKIKKVLKIAAETTLKIWQEQN